MNVKWYLFVILLCVFLMTSDLSIFSCVYGLFVYLLWRNVYSSILSFFELGFLLLLSFESSLYTLDINPLSDIWFINIFSHLMSCLSLC